MAHDARGGSHVRGPIELRVGAVAVMERAPLADDDVELGIEDRAHGGSVPFRGNEKIADMYSSPSMRRVLCVLSLFVLVFLDGCSCRKKTDEEILKERIDAMPVHLWLSAKIALGTDDTSKDVKTARTLLLELIDAAIEKDPKAGVHQSDASRLARHRPLAAARARKRGVREDPRRRAQAGVASVAEGGLGAGGDPGGNLRASLFRVGRPTAKVHPDDGSPIPPEILLYEAWWSDVDNMKVKSLGPLVRGFKAYIYGTSELCDLRDKESKQIDSGDLLDADLASDAKLFGAKSVDITKEEARQANAAIALAPRMARPPSVTCSEKSRRRPTRRCTACSTTPTRSASPAPRSSSSAATSSAPTATRRRVAERFNRSSTTTRPRSRARKHAKAIGLLAGKHGGVLGGVTERVVLGTAVGLLAYEYLDRSGLVDDLKDTPVARAIGGLVGGVSSALSKGRLRRPVAGRREEQGQRLVALLSRDCPPPSEKSRVLQSP